MTRTTAPLLHEYRLAPSPDPLELACAREAASRAHPFAACSLSFDSSRLGRTKLFLFNVALSLYSAITRVLSSAPR